MSMLQGKTAFVTGASRGIGAATALALSEAGCHVVIAARTVSGLERTHDEILEKGGTATIMPLDLKKWDEIDHVGPTLFERFGGLDIFVACAGVLGGLRPVAHHNPKVWDETFRVNVHANFRLIRTLDPLLRRSEAGRAVFVSTKMADRNEEYWSLYAASKAALDSMVKTYANEIVNSPLKVNLIHPGTVATSMLNEAFPGGYQGQTHSVEEAASEIVKLCLPDVQEHGTKKVAFS